MQAQANPFKLELPLVNPFKFMVEGSLERLFRLSHLRDMYLGLDKGLDRDSASFPAKALDRLGIDLDLRAGAMDSIPAQGPAVVTANHPFGAVEGIALIHLLRLVRPDVKVMANSLLARVPEMQDHIIGVDPFGTGGSTSRNIAPLKACVRHVRTGGLLAIFPAGEVSSLRLKSRSVTDPAWSPTIGRIIRMTKAPVIPLHFDGKNGAMFQLLGLMHPRLRTALLPRELLNKQRRTLGYAIGSAIPAKQLTRFESDEKLIQYLRLRTYALGQPTTAKPKKFKIPTKKKPSTLDNPAPVAEAIPAQTILHELTSLPSQNHLLNQSGFDIYCAPGLALPSTLAEIGRLREIAFREVGEGTGRSRDLDRFDNTYDHLVLVDSARQRIAGAYRIGPTDRVLKAHGAKGLYTNTLFKYKQSFLEHVTPGLELGRAFVTADYRKSYNPLMLLWKGIARYVCANPQYSKLFGPVSISADYAPTSISMMVRYLDEHHAAKAPLLASVTPRTPPKLRPPRMGGLAPNAINAICPDIADLAHAVADIEHDNKGIPVLLKHYLKLGGEILAFNRDDDFAGAIDGLILVDLARAPQRTLTRFMGKVEAATFLTSHLPPEPSQKAAGVR